MMDGSGTGTKDRRLRKEISGGTHLTTAPTTSALLQQSSPMPAVCADCSADDPQWASLNRGVLVCAECTHVHRNLGRHVSYIRSLKKGAWHSAQLELMYALHNNGANNIWEHSLLDPQSSAKIRKKPTPRDPVFPTKENFIKAKYNLLSFALRPNRDDDPLNADDLNRQLWSCVRTSHVETTLRLLALGADPNYFDREKCNSPMHIAAKEGQTLQVELLAIYGADAGRPNATGLTPAEVAKLENHIDLANRLDELRFEVTNRLSMFLCGRKPDHTRDQHFLVPELTGENTNDKTANNSLKKLQLMSDGTFEKFAQDVYDEVDRRETTVAWNACLQTLQQPVYYGHDQFVAVFLPPNQELSATRNQSRQKLAKFDTRELAVLIIDVLKEAKRRYLGQNIPEEIVDQQRQLTGATDESRDYDHVPESPPKSLTSPKRSSGNKTIDILDTNDGSGVQLDNFIALDEYLELKEKLNDTQSRFDDIIRSNSEILRQLSHVMASVDRLSDENVELRVELRAQRQLLPSPISLSCQHANSHPPKPIGITSTGESRNKRHASISATTPATTSNVALRSFEPIRNGSAPPTEWQPTLRHRSLEYPDNLIIETEQLTLSIKRLLSDAQDQTLPITASRHADEIRSVTDRLVALVPFELRSSIVDQCLQAMTDACVSLTIECNAQLVLIEETCQAAYNLAKAAKQLLLVIQR